MLNASGQQWSFGRIRFTHSPCGPALNTSNFSGRGTAVFHRAPASVLSHLYGRCRRTVANIQVLASAPWPALASQLWSVRGRWPEERGALYPKVAAVQVPKYGNHGGLGCRCAPGHARRSQSTLGHPPARLGRRGRSRSRGRGRFSHAKALLRPGRISSPMACCCAGVVHVEHDDISQCLGVHRPMGLRHDTVPSAAPTFAVQ